MEQNESMVFYRSFYEAVVGLDPSDREKALMAICGYGIDGVEPEIDSPIAKAVFIMAKPQIDANVERRKNGKKGGQYGVKGGRPKKEKENPIGVIDENPIGVMSSTPTETPNVNVNANANVNANENVNVNANENEDIHPSGAARDIKHKHGEYGHVKLTDKEHEALVNDLGEQMTNQCITYLDEYMEMKGAKYKSCYMAIRKWVINAVKEHQPKQTNNSQADELEEFYQRMADWAQKEG